MRFCNSVQDTYIYTLFTHDFGEFICLTFSQAIIYVSGHINVIVTINDKYIAKHITVTKKTTDNDQGHRYAKKK